jgi:hypothetical protein
MIAYEEMIKVIANEYVANSPDGRSRERVYTHMLGNFKKGWLNKDFVNGCYDAIMAGKHVEFFHDPKNELYGYLAGKDAETMASVLDQMRSEGASVVDKDGKEIRKMRFP